MGRFIGVYILDIGYEQMPLFARQGGYPPFVEDSR